MLSIKAASCKLSCGLKEGSGFFVSLDHVLTAKHNLDHGNEINGEGYGGEIFSLELVDTDDDTDMVLLKIQGAYKSGTFLHICSLEPIAGISWESFGHPKTVNGRTIGETLSGSIKDFANGVNSHDTILNVEGYNVTSSVYHGFSGSPVVDFYGNAIGMLRFSGNNSLDAVSIKKAGSFLERNGIIVKKDYLLDFGEYACNCFSGFEETPKRMCAIYADRLRSTIEPNDIARDLLGRLYYPHTKGDLNEIISFLKNNPEINQGLWKGWLELLSYLSMVTSSRPDFNNITVTLTAEKFTKLFGIKRETAADTIDVNLNFFWTQGTAYLNIISDYLHNKLLEGIENNTCYIFNSADPHFGRRGPKANFKENIVFDISGGEDAGFHIVKEMNFGVLSLNELSQQVLECDSIASARPKIEQLFIDALQHD
ncbi:S1 family peptidase [Pedobacter antarcticus]|nr:serine protease [Pedobacter antarcticus]